MLLSDHVKVCYISQGHGHVMGAVIFNFLGSSEAQVHACLPDGLSIAEQCIHRSFDTVDHQKGVPFRSSSW